MLHYDVMPYQRPQPKPPTPLQPITHLLPRSPTRRFATYNPHLRSHGSCGSSAPYRSRNTSNHSTLLTLTHIAAHTCAITYDTDNKQSAQALARACAGAASRKTFTTPLTPSPDSWFTSRLDNWAIAFNAPDAYLHNMFYNLDDTKPLSPSAGADDARHTTKHDAPPRRQLSQCHRNVGTPTANNDRQLTCQKLTRPDGLDHHRCHF